MSECVLRRVICLNDMNNDPDISFLDLIKLFSDLAEFEEITESLILILAVGDEFSDYL